MGGIFVLFALAACVMGESFHYYGHDYDRTPLGDAIDKASMKMLKEGFESSNEKNVVASPLGVLTLLSLYSSGAGDDSKAEIYRTLGGTDGKKLSDSYSGLSQQFSAMDPSYLTLANKIYVSDGYKLADNFTLAAESYKSEVELINFRAKAAAADKINQWANEKTRGHIKSPVSPDAITSDTVAALFNVIFFQGHWHVPFEAAETKDKDFHIDEKTTVKKPTMHLLQSLFYHSSQDLDAQLIELPYKESGFRMVVVLPNEINGLPSLLKKVAEKGILADVFALEPSGRDVNLDMPKFDIKSKWNLNDILPKMGISSIFSEPAPGVVRDSNVKVSKAFQEAFIKVDEEGATAGAFTGVVIIAVSSIATPPPAMEFKVDHPFLYLILHEDKILFTGTYSH